MAVISPAKLGIISQNSARDPKKAIWDALGKAIDKINPMGSLILVGTYIAPDRSAGGILYADKSMDEDLFQGSMGLVLKLGPTCFMDDAFHAFHGQQVNVNDWVIFRYSSAWEIHLAGVSVRFVPDSEIKGTVEHPAIVTSRPIAALGG